MKKQLLAWLEDWYEFSHKSNEPGLKEHKAYLEIMDLIKEKEQVYV